MARDLQAEISMLRAERHVLHSALGQQVAERPWPREGDTILISSDWDGRALHGQDTFLTLSAGSRVTIAHVSEEGWLWGTVERTGQAGWLGGHGCSAEQQVTVSVPLGPGDPSAVLPTDPFRESTESTQLWECELEEFFAKYGVDDSAQQAVKELPMEEQKRVLETELMNCRNPSAVLLSRIRTLQRSRAVGLAAAAPAGHAQPPPPLAARPRSRSPRRQASAAEVEEYIQRHEVDEAAAQALRALPADRQLEVMVSDLNNCRNPSAVLMGRIRAQELGSKQNQQHVASLAAALPAVAHYRAAPLLSLQVPAQHQGAAVAVASALLAHQTGQLVGGHMNTRTEEFIQRHSLDEAAAQALRELPVHSQSTIIEADLVNVRNPSAVVQSRIQAFRQGGAAALGAPAPAAAYAPGQREVPGAGSAVHTNHVEDYIRRFQLDEKVAHELRVLDPEAQRQVLESDIVNARNPSAVVTKRIQEARSRTAGAFNSFGRR